MGGGERQEGYLLFPNPSAIFMSYLFPLGLDSYPFKERTSNQSVRLSIEGSQLYSLTKEQPPEGGVR